MLSVEKGNVFKKGMDVVMHQANCYATMGAGIAREIKRNYPEAYEADKEYGEPLGEARLGQFSMAKVDGGKFTIVNLYGQLGYGRGGVYTQVDKLEDAMRGALEKLSEEYDLQKLKIGIPYKIGCVLAGGNWGEVRKMIKQVAKDYSITINAYKL